MPGHVTEVFDLSGRTGSHVYSLPAREAVLCAHAQYEKRDQRSFDYHLFYAVPNVLFGRTVGMGDMGAAYEPVDGHEEIFASSPSAIRHTRTWVVSPAGKRVFVVALAVTPPRHVRRQATFPGPFFKVVDGTLMDAVHLTSDQREAYAQYVQYILVPTS